jgi:hypothetical protein
MVEGTSTKNYGCEDWGNYASIFRSDAPRVVIVSEQKTYITMPSSSMTPMKSDLQDHRMMRVSKILWQEE